MTNTDSLFASVRQDAESAGAAPSPPKSAVRERMDRGLNGIHFRNAKRSQSLLRFVTESLLAQDDLEPEHAGGLRIGMPPGSYAPVFGVPETASEPCAHAIVIGVFNSRWALRFGDGMRFIFERRMAGGFIADPASCGAT